MQFSNNKKTGGIGMNISDPLTCSQLAFKRGQIKVVVSILICLQSQYTILEKDGYFLGAEPR